MSTCFITKILSFLIVIALFKIPNSSDTSTVVTAVHWTKWNVYMADLK